VNVQNRYLGYEFYFNGSLVSSGGGTGYLPNTAGIIAWVSWATLNESPTGVLPAGSYVCRVIAGDNPLSPGGTPIASLPFTISGNPSPTSPPVTHAAPSLSGLANLRWCTNFALAQRFCLTSLITALPAGTEVTMVCWRDDSPATGAYKSARWFYIKSGNLEGFVHSSWVKNQAVVPNCSTFPWIGAADWAIAQLGNVSPTDQQRLAADPAMTVWTDWCWGFSWDAWNFGAGKKLNRGTALAVAGTYNLIKSTPPRGAVVFWKLPAGSGHAAVSLGNGELVGTIGVDVKHPVPVARYSVASRSGLGFLGWYRPGG
jgi:hypothetical protein